MVYNPLHPHCGPGNVVSSVAPVDPIDKICWDHDRRYGDLQKRYGQYWPYSHWNYADDRFIKDIYPYIYTSDAAFTYWSAFQAKKGVTRVMQPNTRPKGMPLSHWEDEQKNQEIARRSAYGHPYNTGVRVDMSLPQSVSPNPTKKHQVSQGQSQASYYKQTDLNRYFKPRPKPRNAHKAVTSKKVKRWSRPVKTGGKGKTVRFRSLSKKVRNGKKGKKRSRSKA